MAVDGGPYLGGLYDLRRDTFVNTSICSKLMRLGQQASTLGDISKLVSFIETDMKPIDWFSQRFTVDVREVLEMLGADEDQRASVFYLQLFVLITLKKNL